MIQGATFDHLAIAVERHGDAWPRYVERLGGQWCSGGRTVGFAPAQIAFARGTRLEILEPNQIDRHDFLRRFLDRHGPSPHHLTFKVPDLDEALAAVDGGGWSTVGVDRSDPEWMEAFIHPKSGPGIVIQLAQAPEEEWRSPRPPDFPEDPAPPADLRWVALAVPDLGHDLALFEGCLGGSRRASGHSAADAARWIELSWGGPGRLRLLEPSGAGPVRDWLGDRPGRLHHVAFAVADPASEPDARPFAEGAWDVAPEAACGARLRLLPGG